MSFRVRISREITVKAYVDLMIEPGKYHDAEAAAKDYVVAASNAGIPLHWQMETPLAELRNAPIQRHNLDADTLHDESKAALEHERLVPRVDTPQQDSLINDLRGIVGEALNEQI